MLRMIPNQSLHVFRRAKWCNANAACRTSTMIAISRSDGTALIYDVAFELSDEQHVTDVRCRFIGEVSSSSVETAYFPLGPHLLCIHHQHQLHKNTRSSAVAKMSIRSLDESHCGEEVLPTIVLHSAGGDHACTSSEPLPRKLSESHSADVAAGSSCDNTVLSTRSCTEKKVSRMGVMTADALRILSPTNSKPASHERVMYAVVVYTDGSAYVCPFGEEGFPKMMAPVRHPTQPAVTCALVAQDSQTSLYLILGNELGEVEVWSEEHTMLETLSMHSDAVIALFAPPKRTARVNIAFASVAQDGSMALYQVTGPNNRLGVAAIFHSPCHHVCAVYWDSAREYCFMQSAEGTAVWHLLTFKLERAVDASADRLVLPTHLPNMLEPQSQSSAVWSSVFTEESTSPTVQMAPEQRQCAPLCSLERLQFVTGSSYAIVVNLQTLLEQLAVVSLEDDVCTTPTPLFHHPIMLPHSMTSSCRGAQGLP